MACITLSGPVILSLIILWWNEMNYLMKYEHIFIVDRMTEVQ